MGELAEPRFGRLLRQLRLSAGLTQEALADMSGLSVRGISDLERGRRRMPRMTTIHMLADALGIDDTVRVRLIHTSRPYVGIPAGEHMTSDAAVVNRKIHNLPHSLTSIVGRTRDVAQITAAIHRPETRLLTLIGPGGIGKTRLALELAENLTHAFASGAHFVPLVPLNSADLVIPAIAETLDLHQAEHESLQAALSVHLRDAEMLLLLDNFEHVLDAADDIQELLTRCPQLKVVATSRAPLHLRMEHLYTIEPLDLPEAGAPIALADLERFDALALFVDRARMADSTFEPTGEHLPAIAAICQRLDGLPLAIELAAARLRVVSVGELQAMLGVTLPVLTGGSRDLPVRHRTLQNTINWSYTLLSESDRNVFRKLSVFAGGWTLDAARAVTSGQQGITTGIDVLNSTGDLVDHSLVRRIEGTHDVTRYGMLQTIREFGSEQLAAHSEVDDTRHRHAHYFLAFIESLHFELPSVNEPECLNLVARDHDNLRVALRWFISRQDGAGALALCSAMSRFWTFRGNLDEARAWVNEALAIADPAPGPVRAQALYTGCLLACHQGDLDQAQQFAHDSLAVGRELNSDVCIVTALLGVGLVAQLREEFSNASEVYAESIVLARKLSHPKLTVIIGNLAQVQYHLGNAERAITLLNECVALDRVAGDIPHIGGHLTDLGLVLLECGDIQPADSAFREALRIHQEVGHTRMIIITIEGFAGIAANRGSAERAAMLYGASEALRRRNAYPQQDPAQWSYQKNLTLARDDLSNDVFEQALDSGRALSLDEAIELALEPLTTSDQESSTHAVP